MMEHDTGSDQAQAVARRLEAFLGPLGRWLDDRIDRRLARTFFLALQAIVRLRHSRSGLLLSELGGYVLSPDQAPAGTKRLSNLLRSPRWSHQLLSRFLWLRAGQALKRLRKREEVALAIWDESVLEKPESIKTEGLCAVRSSKAARIKRIKPGFFTPPGGPPVFVPGMQWLTVMIAGMQGPPALAAMRWWSSRGKLASDRTTQTASLLEVCVRGWGRQVVHVFDRGFAGAPWLMRLGGRQLRFVLRWPTRYQLSDSQGLRAAWKITRGKRSQDHRLLWDIHQRRYRNTGIVFVPVRHSAIDQQLWLVVSRPGKGRRPWYLLTNEPVEKAEDAWRIVLAYARRWQVEMCYRACKTDLAMESPRLWFWENRLKLLLMVSIVYAFLLSMLSSASMPLIQDIFRRWRHRTGKRYREAAIPLSRLRAALSTLWNAHPPAFQAVQGNSG
ncbi:MAG: hypothetical protein ACOC5M_02960 [Chloroflexota bacterium]